MCFHKEWPWEHLVIVLFKVNPIVVCCHFVMEIPLMYFDK